MTQRKAKESYDQLVPLMEDGRPDAAIMRTAGPGIQGRTGGSHRQAPPEAGRQCYFDYQEGERTTTSQDPRGDEMFVTGEYVSIMHRDGAHTYQVARVARP